MRERITTTVTSLLGLIGIEADPVQSREHILLSTIIDHLWRAGQDLDLAQLITQVQNPPVTKIGVLDLESFYPSKDRFALVMALNNLLASPGFSAWLEGEPLDIGQILYTPQGKPRVAIFSIAHLSDAERMFFVSLLLNQVLGWMRAQSGTTSLRALLYMDEIFGYLPPLSNPPSKMPLLTLLKQARAFGLGLVLATQNPVDLDYKALSNAGTWFIGRLQTERDKARVLDGLEGAAAAAGSAFDRQDIDRILSGLGSRVFLMNNTHEDAAGGDDHALGAVVPARPADPRADPHADGAGQSRQRSLPRSRCTPAAAAAPASAAAAAAAASRQLPPAIRRGSHRGRAAPGPAARDPAVLPAHPRARPGRLRLVYQPRILGVGAGGLRRHQIAHQRGAGAPVPGRKSPTRPSRWIGKSAETLEVAISDLEKRPRMQPGAVRFAALPAAAGQAKNYTAWTREFATWLYGIAGAGAVLQPQP